MEETEKNRIEELQKELQEIEQKKMKEFEKRLSELLQEFGYELDIYMQQPQIIVKPIKKQ